MELKACLPPHTFEAVNEENFPYFFGRSLQGLYLEFQPQVKGTVFVCTQVHNGFGDYIALLKAGWALKKAHPDLNIELVYTYTKALPEVDTQGLLTHPFLEHPDHPVLEPILEGKKIEEVSAEAILAETLYDRMKESLAIIHIALALNTFDNPELKAKSIYFAEVGNFMGVKDSIHFNWYSLGFSPFEEGVFLDLPVKTKENPELFFGYFSRSDAQKMLFKELAFKLQEKAKFEIPEKTLAYREFIEKMADSAFLVGCTGDNSLSECLALKKVPYYEILPHKTQLMLSLYNLAKHLDLVSITHYFLAVAKGEKASLEELLSALKNPSFEKEWPKFIEYLHKYCRLEDALVSRLRRLLFGTASIELELANKMLKKELDFPEAWEQMKKELREKSL